MEVSARRILFAAEFWDGSVGAGLAEGFSKCGHYVEKIDFRDYFNRFGRTIPGRIANRLSFKGGILAYNRAVTDAAERCSPDLFVTVKGSYLSEKTISVLHEAGTFRLNYYPDVSFDHPGLSLAALKRYDLIATTKSFQLPWLKQNIGAGHTAFLHHGFSDRIHVPTDVPGADSEFDWDICYVGNPSPYKCDWLVGICNAFPQARIAIAGHGWNKQKHGLSGAELLPAVIAGDFARLLSRSKINLGIHYGPHGPFDWEDKVSTRTFEIPACQGFMLHIENDEVRSLFETGREIDMFATPAQLNERIAFYLANPDERMAIAKAGYERAVPAYGLHARAREMLAIVEAHAND